MLVMKCNMLRMGLIISFAVLLNLLNMGLAVKIVAEEYSWKDFKEVIPSDALRGESDRNGRPIYIGKIVRPTHDVPAKIYFDGKVDYQDCKDHSDSPQIQILCAQQPEKFEWIATNNEDIKLLKDWNFVTLGDDKPGTVTHIGRVRLNDEIAIGNVNIQSGTDGLQIKRNGVSEKYSSFEILAFKPKPDVDVRFGSIQ